MFSKNSTIFNKFKIQRLIVWTVEHFYLTAYTRYPPIERIVADINRGDGWIHMT